MRCMWPYNMTLWTFSSCYSSMELVNSTIHHSDAKNPYTGVVSVVFAAVRCHTNLLVGVGNAD